MANKYRSRRSKTNWDRRDGLKVNRVQDNWHVSKYKHSMTMWDLDNIVLSDDSDGNIFHRHVSIVKELRKLNHAKCRKINGYNGKLNGRQ